MPRPIKTRAAVIVLSLCVPTPLTWSAERPACPLRSSAPCQEEGGAQGTRVRCQTDAGVREFAAIDAYCLGCHDGKTAPGRVCPGVKPQLHGSLVTYPRGRADLRAPSTLDPHLKLRDGRITCATCHGGPKTAVSFVSIPMAGSALCLACHVK